MCDLGRDGEDEITLGEKPFLRLGFVLPAELVAAMRRG